MSLHGVLVFAHCGDGRNKLCRQNWCTYYETVQAAIDDAQEGNTIILLTNVELTENIMIDNDLTISGGTLTVYTNQAGSNEGGRIQVTNGATLTLSGVTLTGSFAADIAAPYIGVTGASKLIVDDSTISDTSSTYSSAYGLINTMGATIGSKVAITNSTVTSMEGSSSGATYYVLGWRRSLRTGHF